MKKKSTVTRIKPRASAPAVARKIDRVSEMFAAAGLDDREIENLKIFLPVLPIDAELVGRARAFISANPAGWNHAAWTEFLTELSDAGYAVGPDRARFHLSQRFIGVLLETIRAARVTEISKAA